MDRYFISTPTPMTKRYDAIAILEGNAPDITNKKIREAFEFLLNDGTIYNMLITPEFYSMKATDMIRNGQLKPSTLN